jgi:hypothetical protein
MHAVVIKVTPHDCMRMKAIVIEADKTDALNIVKELLRSVEAAASGGLKNHLDK